MEERTATKIYFQCIWKKKSLLPHIKDPYQTWFLNNFDFSFEKPFVKKSVNYQFLYSNQQWFAICAPR